MTEDYNSEEFGNKLDLHYQKAAIERVGIYEGPTTPKIIAPHEEKLRGKFTKDLLLNTYFEHTDLFSPAANKFLKEGKYSGEIFNSKKYNLFWGEERERCIYGYNNPITKVWIPGKHYFFLNYKQMKIVPPGQEGKKSVKRITSFPRFWAIHYFYLQDWVTAKDNGLNMIVLKPRDTGFSELLSSNGVHEYTFQTEDPVFFFVAVERFLNKDGVLSKAWDQINFLNQNTERAFKHLRQKKDQDLYKRASFFDQETGVEIKTGGEIQGAVIDNPRKVRGARGFVNWEEFGSFPNGRDAWMTAVALAEQGGVKFAMQTAWGTGGEQGPGIAAMDEIFNNPERFDCLPFINCWEDGILPNDHGFFFPVWANMTKFMDKWGNTDHAKAQQYWEERRIKTGKGGSNTLMDKLVAEFPFTPMEALMRLNNNPFPVEKLQKQLRKVDASPEIQGVLKIGELDIEEGKVMFQLNNRLDPVNRYPHKTDAVLNGAFTMFEAPLKDPNNKVPDNLYYIVADCFYVDTEQATEWNSLGSYYVYKKKNSIFPTEDDILVAWYAGRPPKAKDFHKNVFKAARFYNAIVQTEIKGGGNDLLNYAKEKGFLQYCGERPTVFNVDKEQKKTGSRQFFVRVEDSNKPELLQKLADWLLHERSLTIEGGETQYVLNLERIYDRALLEELIKYQPLGNFDRISCLLVLMAIVQEAELQQVMETTKKNRDHIFNRPLFSDTPNHRNNMLSRSEMVIDGKNNDIIW